jgi:hypothetical protein
MTRNCWLAIWNSTGAILIASGDPPHSYHYRMLVAADRLQSALSQLVLASASWLVTTLSRPATA